MSNDVYSVRLIEGGNIGRPIPEHVGASVSTQLSVAGSLSIRYPRNAAFAAEVVAGREIAILRNGVELANMRYFMEESGEDLTDMNEDARQVEVTGRSFQSALEDGIVYPQSWPSFDPPNHAFTAANAGTIMSTLIERAKNRGTLFRGLTYTFTSAVDSNGVAWSKAVTIQYDAGVKLTDVLDNLVVQGLCEVETQGRELRLINPSGALERHLETGPTAIVFRKGRDVTDTPNKTSLRELRTTALVAGKDNIYIEWEDAGARATWGRKETYLSQGGIPDGATLTAYAQSEIARVSIPKLERTHGVLFDDDNSPRPFSDYRLGDWVGSDVGMGTIEAYRIRQISIDLDDQGLADNGQVVLNDLFAEREAALSRRINGIINGTTITGASNAVVDPGSDTIPPKAPSSLAFSSIAITDFNLGRAQVTATWTKPTQNIDNTAYTDHAGYEFQWKYFSDANYINGVMPTNTESITFGPVEQNRALTVQVRAVDNNGNRSAWAEYTGATAIDTIPPPQPSQPTVVGDLGYLRVNWDGKGSAAQGMPGDTRYVEVHSSTTNNFVPVSTGGSPTIVDLIPIGGQAVYIAASYTATTYVKLIAVDASGNRSTASAQASGTASPVLSADVFDGAIGTAKLADAAIVTAKIADATITDAKIQNLSVGKLTAGTLSAAVILSGSIATASAGARVSMTNAGLRMFDSGGVERVNILSNGNATFSGYLQATQILGTVSAIDSATGRRVDVTPGGYLARPSITMSTGAAIEKSPAGWTMGSDPFLRQLVTYMYAPGTTLVANGIDYQTATIMQMETVPLDGDFANATTLATRITGTARFIFPVPAVDSGGTILRNSPQWYVRADLPGVSNVADQGRYPGWVLKNYGGAEIGMRLAYVSGTSGDAMFHVCNGDASAFRRIAATAFDAFSASETKEDIQDVSWKALDVVTKNPAKRWRYKDTKDRSVSSTHVGPMADNLPDEVLSLEGKGIDLTSMVGLLWKAIEEMQDEKWLTKRMKKLGYSVTRTGSEESS